MYDVQARLLRADKPVDSRIKVILVDEAALNSMADIAGRWPWPRAIWADLLDFLSMGGAKAVLFDILFTERQDDANDKALIEATMASQNVYHSIIIKHDDPDPEAKNNNDLNRPMPPEFIGRFAVKNVSGSLAVHHGAESNAFSLPIIGLPEASKSIAVVEFKPDADNSYRRTQPLREYQGRYFPVLGLAPFVNEESKIVINPDSIVVNDRKMPVDHNGNVIINMYGLDKIDTYSMSGVFASLQKIRKGEVEDLLVNPEVFKDSIVFIGVSAVGGRTSSRFPWLRALPE